MEKVIDHSDLIGKPFKFGGRGPDEYDCWGIVMEVCRRLEIHLPDFGKGCEYLPQKIHNTQESFQDRFILVNSPIPGDIVAFRFPLPNFVGHIAVYIGQNRIIHTREATNTVCERLNAPQWRKRIYGIYRYRKHIN